MEGLKRISLKTGCSKVWPLKMCTSFIILIFFAHKMSFYEEGTWIYFAVINCNVIVNTPYLANLPDIYTRAQSTPKINIYTRLVDVQAEYALRPTLKHCFIRAFSATHAVPWCRVVLLITSPAPINVLLHLYHSACTLSESNE